MLRKVRTYPTLGISFGAPIYTCFRGKEPISLKKDKFFYARCHSRILLFKNFKSGHMHLRTKGINSASSEDSNWWSVLNSRPLLECNNKNDSSRWENEYYISISTLSIQIVIKFINHVIKNWQSCLKLIMCSMSLGCFHVIVVCWIQSYVMLVCWTHLF